MKTEISVIFIVEVKDQDGHWFLVDVFSDKFAQDPKANAEYRAQCERRLRGQEFRVREFIPREA